MALSQTNPSLLLDPRREIWHDFTWTGATLVPFLLHSITCLSLTNEAQAERDT